MTVTQTRPPRIGEVWLRDGHTGEGGHQTVVLRRRLDGTRHAILAVCDRGARRYQTWTFGESGRNRDIQSYTAFDSAHEDWQARR